MSKRARLLVIVQCLFHAAIGVPRKQYRHRLVVALNPNELRVAADRLEKVSRLLSQVGDRDNRVHTFGLLHILPVYMLVCTPSYEVV